MKRLCLILLVFTASQAAAAPAPPSACRLLAGPMATVNDQISNMARTMENFQQFRERAERDLGGPEGKALADYFSAANDMAAAMRLFLKSARPDTLVIQACADN